MREGRWIVLGLEADPSTGTLVSSLHLLIHLLISRCSFYSESLRVEQICTPQLFCSSLFYCYSRVRYYLRWERILRDPLPHRIQMCLDLRPSHPLVIPNLAFGMENSRPLIREAPKLNVVDLVIYPIRWRGTKFRGSALLSAPPENQNNASSSLPSLPNLDCYAS